MTIIARWTPLVNRAGVKNGESERFRLRKPQAARRVRRHTPVASGAERHGADLRAVRDARALELLLEEAAVEAGYEVKIETQGADGIQNRLTAQDIAEATLIIHSVAVTPEDNERFESRDVYEITLQDAIKNAAGIIKEIEEMVAAEQQ